MSKGLDYSWARPDPAQIKQKGYGFVMRYLATNGAGKEISAGEAANLRAAGLAIGLVWETYVGRPLAGRAAGKADAQAALEQARGVGFPDDKPIYFAVDFDATEAQQGVIDEYLRGAAEVLGANRVGVYGGYYIVKRCAQNGSAAYYWQTLAWSGGQVFDGAHIYQNGATDFGNGADVDEGRKDNIGVWGSNEGGSVPTPAPAPSGEFDSYQIASGDTLSGIAARYGTTYQYLAQINGIADPNKISAGATIKVPHVGGSAPAPTPQPNGAVYTVRSGDTLSAIGAKFGVDYHLIAQANGISDPNKIYAGQTLRIPGGGAVNPAPATLYYTIQSGDTLSGIANKYGTTYQHLAAINGIADPNKINAGQTIRIS
jgi:LysM repeat protein